ncbi:DUF7507 domain-containing protein [Luteimonas kalidii]|uniref:OmpA family protein n=1 Tax=Luteimonas kalidii TaxID=3042025 RepID=A0ABT6JSA5_9GAMM|nr:OmpA family protein [Luteimonas kalidii]MDH5833569.1 OmpA family protein [Luteimonas kalidii]
MLAAATLSGVFTCASALAQVQVSNSAEVAVPATVADSDPGNDSSAATVDVYSVAVGKTASPASGTAVSVGETIEYSVEVTVTGGTPPGEPVVVTDTLGSGLELTGPLPAGCVAAGQVLTCSIDPGSTFPVTLVYSATVTDAAGESVGNSVTGGDSCAAGCTTSHPVYREVSLTKLWDDPAGGGAVDLVIAAVSGTVTDAVPGSSTSGGATTPATANAEPGAVVSIAETFTTGDSANYVTTFECATAGGDPVPVTANGTSASFTMPAGEGVACTITNTRAQATLQLVKQWQDALAGDTATVTGLGATSGVSTADATGDNATAGDPIVVYAGQSGAITETLGNAANYDASLACTGNANPLVGDTLTVAPGDTAIVCTYTNARVAATLALEKSWVNAAVGETATVTATGSDAGPAQLDSVADTATETDTAGPFEVFAGETITLAETLSNADNYSSELVCTGAANWTAGASAFEVSPTDTAITCGYTNTRLQTQLRLEKVWGPNSQTGDTAQLGPTTGLVNNTAPLAVTAPTGGLTPFVVVYAGEVANLPAETMGGGALDNYDVEVACTGGTLGGTDGTVGNTLEILPGDTGDIVCTYTNNRVETTLQLQKTWQNAIAGDSVSLLSTGNPAFPSTATGAATQTDTSAEFPVYAGDVVNLTESFVGDPAVYASSLECTGTDSLVAAPDGRTGTITVGASDGPIVCTFTNDRRSAQLVVAKVWDGGGPPSQVTIPASSGFINNTPQLVSTSPTNSQTAPVTVFVEEDGTLPAEQFTTGDPADYDSAVACDGADDDPADGLLIQIADAGSTITCTYSNTFVKRAALAVDKTVTSAPATDDIVAGSVIEYQVVVTNSGNVPLTAVDIADDLADDLTCAPGEPLDLDVGESTTCTASYTVTQDDIDRVAGGNGADGTLTNTATADGTDPDGETVQGEDSTDTQLPANLLEFGFSKDAQLNDSDGSLGGSAGETIDYTFTLTNEGNTSITITSLVDPQLSGLSCAGLPYGPVPPGGTVEFGPAAPADIVCSGLTYTITQDDIDAQGTAGSGEIQNTATASGEGPQGGSDSRDASDNVPLDPPQPEIELDKSASPSSVSTAPTTVTYTFDVTNPGNVTVTGITVTDPLPGLGPVACTPAAPFDLAPGASAQCTAEYTVTQADLDAGADIVNTASADGSYDGIPVDDQDSAVVDVDSGPAQPEILKFASPTSVTAAGDVVTYTFRATNPSSRTLLEVEIVDDPLLPALDCDTIPTLAPGASADFTCTGNTYEVQQSDIDAYGNPAEDSGELVNTVTGQAQYEEDGSTIIAQDTATATVDLPTRAPSIFLTKGSDVDSVTEAGDTIAYTFNVLNNGNVTLTGIEISDPLLPGLDCPAIPTLAPAEDADFTCTGSSNVYTVTQDDIDDYGTGGSGQIVNTATVVADAPTGATVQDDDDHQVSLPVRSAEMTLVKNASVASITGPVTVQYDFVLTNTGNVTVNDVVVADPALGMSCPVIPELLPAQVLTLGPAGSDVVCTGTGRVVDQADVDAGGTVDNTATATGQTVVDGELSRSDTLGIPINQNPQLTFGKSADVASVTVPGDPIVYTITGENTGNTTLVDVTVTDPLLASPPGGVPLSCSPASPIATLPPGESFSCSGTYLAQSADFDTNGGGDGDIDNTATAAWTGGSIDASASVALPVAVRELTLDKSAGTPTVEAGVDASVTDAGDTIPYTFEVTNTGNQTITGILIVDANLDAAATCDPADLAAGEVATCTGVHTITQAEMDAGVVENTANARGTAPTGDAITSEPDDAEVILDQAPAITLDKEAGTPTVELGALSTVTDAGDTIAYTFEVTNTGNVTLRDVTLADPLPGLGGISCPTGELAPGASLTCTGGTHTITQAEMDAGSVTNTATATGLVPDGSTTTGEDSTDTPLAAAGAITVAKSASPTTVSAVGATVTYSFLVTNTGNVTLDAVAIDETAFSGTGTVSAISCPQTTLAPGASTTCSGTYAVTQPDLDAGQIDNTAVTTGTEPDGADVTSDPSSALVTVDETAALALVKSVTPTTVAAAGETVTYSFAVTNAGNVTIDALVIDDTAFSGTGAPPTISCPVTELAPGASTTCTSTAYAVTQADLDAGTVTNTATANGTDPGGAAVASDPSDAVVTVDEDATLTLAKSASPATVIFPGTEVTYTFEVENTGNVTLDNLTIDETAFSGTGTAPAITCAATELAPGASTTCSGTYAVTQADINTGQISNTATATATDPAGVAVVSAPDDAIVNAVEVARMTLSKTATPTTVAAVGDTVTYTFEVGNTGNVTLDALAIDETAFSGTGTAPTVTCSATELAPGASTTCTGTAYAVTQEDLDAGEITNTAVANADDPADVAIASDPADAVVTVDEDASLALVKSATPTTVAAVGDTVTYAFEVTNDGNVTIDALAITETAFSGTGTPPTITCPVTELAPGAGTTCSGTYDVTQADLDAGTITNTATANGTDPGGTAVVSDPSDATVTVDEDASLTLVKSASPTTVSSVDETVTYSFEVGNDGNVTIDALVIAETAFSGTGSAPAITCPVTELAPGASTTCSGTYQVTQADLDAGSITNTATASGTDPADTPVVSDPSAATVTVDENASLTLLKSASPTTVSSVDEVVTYSFEVSNDGNVTLDALVITETAFSGTGTPPVITCPVSELAPGTSTTCSGTYLVTQADLDAGSITNTATANGTDPADTPVASDPSDATVTVDEDASLALVKSATPTTVAAVDDTVTYAFEVTNDGNVTIDTVAITETAFSGTGTPPAITCPVTALAPGASTTCSGIYDVTQADLDAGEITNTATANGTDPGGAAVVSEPSDARVDADQAPALLLDKNTSSTGYDSVGDLLQYSYLVTNSGNVTITSPIAVDDDRIVAPNRVDCPALPAGGLVPGDSLTCTATHIVSQADLDAGSVINIATATDGNTVSPPDSETVDGTQTPAIVLDKAATLDDTNGDGVLGDAGDTITYAFSVENTGNVVLAPVTVTDPLLPDLACTVETLAPGDSASCAASGNTYVITTTDEADGSVDNTALATGTSPGPAPDATDEDTESTPTLPTPATTTVAKAADPESGSEVAPGDTVTYTLIVTVADASLHEPVTLTDTLGEGLSFVAVTSAGAFACDAADPLVCTLPVGTAPGDYAVVYTATVDDDASGSVGNNVVATKPDGTDPAPVCTTCDTDHTVVPSTSAVSKASTPASETPVNPGTTITFTLTTVVSGSVTTEPITLVDTLDPGLTFVAVTDVGAYTCSGTLTCVLPVDTLPGSYDVVYTAVVDEDATGVLDNVVVPSNPPGGDADPVCESCSTVHPVSRPAVELAKELTGNDDADGNGEVSVGDTLSYTVTATNTGNVPLANVTIDDPLVTPDRVTCALVAPGAQCQLVGAYTVTQADADAGQVLNEAIVTTEAPPDVPPLPPEACPVGSTAPACTADTITPVVQRPAIATSKTAVLSVDNATPGMGNIGDVITYSVTATNTGNVTLTGVTVSDSFQGGAPMTLACAPTTLAPGQVATCDSYSHTITEDDVRAEEGVLVNTVLALGDAGVASGTVEVTADAAAQVEVQNEPAQLFLVKSVAVREVNVGDLVRYTLTLENTGDVDLVDGTIIDTPAPGFSYVEGSLQGDDDDDFVTASGAAPLRISDIDIAAGNTATMSYLMRVGAGVRPGVQINRALAFDPAYEGPASNVATAEVVLGSDPLLDESLVSGTVFNDRDGDAWQDSAALTGVRVQGGFAPDAYVPGSTTVDRGEGPQPEADASAPLLRGLALGRIEGRRSQADPASTHEVVISQRLDDLAFTDDFVLTSRQGATVRMAADGSTTLETSGDAARGLTAAAPTVQRQVAQTADGYRVDYVVRNEGIDERGIPGVRIASVEGLIMETDQYGRYHLVGIDAGQLARGRNFILKLDAATLPPGSELTTENPKVRRITGGVPTRFDFGVRLPEQVIEGRRQVEMVLGTLVFAPGSDQVQPRYLPVLDRIVEQIRGSGEGEVVVTADGETEALAFARASAVRTLLGERLDESLRAQVTLSVRAEPDDPATLVAGIGEGGPVLGTVLFDTDQSTIRPRYDALLDQVAQLLADGEGRTVSIIGNADRRGSRAYNAALGLRRANAVYEALAQRLPPQVRGQLKVEVDPDPDAPLDALPPAGEGRP